MGLQGQAPGRGRGIARRALFGCAAALLALIVYLYAPEPRPAAAAPTLTDCIELRVWSNGFHTDIEAPAGIFPPDHPLRRLFPRARSFLIGWGDEAFYRADVWDWGQALDAVIPPSPSVLHVAYDAPNAVRYLNPTSSALVGVSHAGAAGFRAYVDAALTLGPDGAPIVLGDGKYVPKSAFLRANGSFHLFNVCNQWMARALRAAGVDVNARPAWFGGGLVRDARRAGRGGCPHSENLPSQPILAP